MRRRNDYVTTTLSCIAKSANIIKKITKTRVFDRFDVRILKN